MSVIEQSASEYHADTGSVRASLSSSIAHVLLSESPRHAWERHPRLNPNYQRTEEDKFDVGTVAHALLLEEEMRAVSLDFPDWRTNAAKEARDAARSRGQIPLLADQYSRVLEMVDAVRRQLEQHHAEPRLLAEGSAEPVLRWEEDNGVECRARLDWLRADLTAIDDLKTTSRSANPQSYARNLYQHGGDIQAAFYIRAAVAAFDIAPPRFRWIVVETTPPYALSVIEPGPDVLTLGNDKVEIALGLWARLLELDGEWPAYPLEVVRAELPPWEESRWLDRRETL